VGGKGKGKSGKKPGSRQDQQQAAARRRAVPQAGAGEQPRIPGQGQPVRDVPLPSALRAARGQSPAAVRYYADIAAVRIQDWLARTPGLIFRRGASALLSKATDPGQWDGSLPPKTRWNIEAGHVDGVVSLVADESVADDAQKVLEEAARRVARRMRALMPHCSIQAVAGEGPSYAEAYSGMAARRREGDFLLDWPSAPPEVILAKPCDQCRLAAATVPDVAVTKDDTLDLCAECGDRLQEAGRTSSTRARLEPAPERRLREALKNAGLTVTGFSDTFAEMAAAGRRERDDTPSQVALLYADGNQVGAFLSKAAGAKDGPAKSEIAPVIEEAAIGALAQAVRRGFAGNDRPPVLPHLAGGDDLLISVPAADAWLFTVTLLSEFGAQIRQATSTWPEAISRHLPSLSAGLVFHHKTAPFSDVVRLAGGQLRAAKNATAGRQATMAFLDLTADGSRPPTGREPLTLRYLQANAERFRRTAALPGSRRATLLDMARRGAWDDFTDRIADLDSPSLREFAAGPGATPEDVRKTLRGDPAKIAEVRRALDVARHWEGT
jgi:hypothetical protein